MDKIPEITPDMAGCWLDGSFGWHNNYRLVELAVAYGYELHTDDADRLERYKSGDPVLMDSDILDIMTELWEEALEHLNEAAPAGYTFETGDGVYLLPVCESDGFEPKYEVCAHCATDPLGTI